MKWLSNIYDPSRSDARQKVSRAIDETFEQAWDRQQYWLRGKVIGRPMYTKQYSTPYLEEQGMVGIYDPTKDDENDQRTS
jgi:hypothetical protein